MKCKKYEKYARCVCCYKFMKKSGIWCTINKYFVCYTLFSSSCLFSSWQELHSQNISLGITERMQTALRFLWIAVIFAAIFQDPLKQDSSARTKWSKCTCPTLLLNRAISFKFIWKNFCSRGEKQFLRFTSQWFNIHDASFVAWNCECADNLINHTAGSLLNPSLT